MDGARPRMEWMSVLALLAECNRAPLALEDATSLVDLGSGAKDLGCYRQGAGWGMCTTEIECGKRAYSTCQFGRCCTGVMDPDARICHCGLGDSCELGRFCCKAHPSWNLPDGEELKCRDEMFCLDSFGGG